ncbi:MAG TPA: DsbA family protein [Paludibacteraceae bacterium]|nr:DsbA family protein [Paludibacteraceae bacterium]
MEQNKITIEFFHDVLCAWCYALSPRVEKLVEKYFDRIEVIHRSFALAPEPNGIEKIFGSKEEGKIQILGHWRAANMNDDAHRMHPELMATRTFDYPYSTPGLLACKAAELQGGNEMHHKIFNRIQKAHLTECLNINDVEVLKMCAREVGLNVEQWEKDFHTEKVKQMLDEDFYLAYQYGINSVPTLIANGKYKLTGAQPYETLEKWINQIK